MHKTNPELSFKIREGRKESCEVPLSLDLQNPLYSKVMVLTQVGLGLGFCIVLILEEYYVL